MRTISIVLITLMLGLSGCAKKTGTGANGTAGADNGGVGDSVRFYGREMSSEQERELLEKNTYYFAYDSNEVSDEDAMSLYAHAKKIAANGSRVRIEGHTDERGSREYNVALGERRAKSIVNILTLKGVSPDQISVVSYGKEKPASMGHDESAWSLNRRVVIVYEG